MTGSHPGPRSSDDDLDPTGVRALLANLPDPGPMPDDLMTRISQSLELEQQRRASAGASPGTQPGSTGDSTGAQLGADPTASSSNVVSLTRERERRRPGRTVLWLGGAAAVAMVATVSVNQIMDGGTADDSGVAADIPASSDSADGGAEAGGAEEDAGSDQSSAADAEQDEAAQAPQAEPTPGDDSQMPPGAGDTLGSTRIYVVAGTVELSSSGWADEVSSWLGTDMAGGESEWGATQADTCIEDSNVDTTTANAVVLSQAVWDTAPATLVVAEATSGDTAWVLSPDCQQILTGPTLLD